MNSIGVYIHIPFCRRKCPYCDFYSIGYSAEKADIYTEKVCSSIRYFGESIRRNADTLYFGGGTPSIIGADRLCKMVKEIKENFDFSNNPEITVEVNPEKENIDFDKMRKNGINRISIGLQSANDSELKILGRLHNVKQAELCIDRAKSAGFQNISLDLMTSTPTQTKYSLEKSIEFCAKKDVQHISAYILKIEQGTPYYNIKETLDICDEDEQAEMYLFTVEKLKEYGYHQYEISNFCKSGYESKHNLKYWHDEEYIGIGTSAHSFVNGKRFYFPRSFEDFYNLKTVSDGEGGSKEEFIMLALRLSEGLTEKRYKNRFGESIPEVYKNNAAKFSKLGFLEINSDGIRLMPKGFLVSNYIISEILG